MSASILFRLQKLLSWFGLIAGLFAALVVVGNYLVSAQQVYRGPSLIYFYSFLFLAICSKRWSTVLLIFSLPLLPNLAIQAEYILHPRVKYFIAYPGVDAVVGLFVGQLIKAIYKKEGLRNTFALPPWPVGMTIFIITISTGITISRNLWQSASTFYVPGFLNNLFRFKHMGLGNDYLVLADLIVYSAATLLLICLLPTLRQCSQRDDFVFKPVMLGLVVSAAWGLSQSFTGFGLPDYTLQYRSDTIGFGALGFQPDIHAFAGYMLIGAVGLFGYMFSMHRDQSRGWTQIIVITCLISWVALILSKSRATFVFAVLFTIFVFASTLIGQNNQKTKRLIIVISLCGVVVLALLSLTGNMWFQVIVDEALALKHINFQTLNRLSVYRLELFGTALKMFAAFPLMGVGQGNFLHLSSVPSYISTAGGENAHNYFLQTAAELGFAGLIGFVLIFITPWFANKNRRSLLSAFVAIVAIFLGNIYSHPLIIRENLLLLTVFVALLYAQAPNVAGLNFDVQRPRLPNLVATLILFSIATYGYFAWSEVTRSYTSGVLSREMSCFKETDKLDDGWMSGNLIIQLPSDANRLRVHVDKNQPDAAIYPLTAELIVTDSTQNVVTTKSYPSLTEAKFSLEIVLPLTPHTVAKGPLRANLLLSRCFTESNFALSDNSKKHGLHIAQIEID